MKESAGRFVTLKGFASEAGVTEDVVSSWTTKHRDYLLNNGLIKEVKGRRRMYDVAVAVEYLTKYDDGLDSSNQLIAAAKRVVNNCGVVANDKIVYNKQLQEDLIELTRGIILIGDGISKIFFAGMPIKDSYDDICQARDSLLCLVTNKSKQIFEKYKLEV